jgi:hypothetical protein
MLSFAPTYRSKQLNSTKVKSEEFASAKWMGKDHVFIPHGLKKEGLRDEQWREINGRNSQSQNGQHENTRTNKFQAGILRGQIYLKPVK